jgi:hypothetical protein
MLFGTGGYKISIPLVRLQLRVDIGRICQINGGEDRRLLLD